MCHFVGEEVFGGAVEEAMRWGACAFMDSGYSLLVHARLCSVQRILRRSECVQKQDEAHVRVEDCIGFGSCSGVH